MLEQKKRILIFSLAYFPHVGGAEVAIKEITDRMLDIEFYMVTLRFDSGQAKEEKIGNVFVHRIGNGNSKLAKFLFQFRAAAFASVLHRQHDFDAVWAMMAHSAGVPATLFKQKHKNVPLLLTLQEGDPPQQIERTMLPLWPWFARAFTLADRVQVISNFLGDWAKRRGAKSIVVIPNGVDVTHFAGAPVVHEHTVLITASRLVHKNAVDDIIRALALLPDHIFLKIVGSGPDEGTLRKLVAELGVPSRVEFVGHVDHAQLPAFLHEADIFIRPSRSEGMGNAFIEAMAAGVPVIGTNVGGIPDFLKDGHTGFFADVDTPQSIATAVEKILADEGATAEVVARARELSKTYDWGMLAVRMRQEAFEPLWQK